MNCKLPGLSLLFLCSAVGPLACDSNDASDDEATSGSTSANTEGQMSGPTAGTESSDVGGEDTEPDSAGTVGPTSTGSSTGPDSSTGNGTSTGTGDDSSTGSSDDTGTESSSGSAGECSPAAVEACIGPSEDARAMCMFECGIVPGCTRTICEHTCWTTYYEEVGDCVSLQPDCAAAAEPLECLYNCHVDYIDCSGNTGSCIDESCTMPLAECQPACAGM